MMLADYDIIGPWTEVKLEILREYAAPYSRILTSNGFCHHYIDGFVGQARMFPARQASLLTAAR